MNKRMWGGRFEQEPDAVLQAINASIDFDRHLYAQDIAGSKAHAAMLAAQGIISPEEQRAVQASVRAWARAAAPIEKLRHRPAQMWTSGWESLAELGCSRSPSPSPRADSVPPPSTWR